jgi:hypothetical protein
MLFLIIRLACHPGRGRSLRPRGRCRDGPRSVATIKHIPGSLLRSTQATTVTCDHHRPATGPPSDRIQVDGRKSAMARV